MISTSSIRTFYSSHCDWILVVVTLVLVTLSAGCSVLTEFDRDMLNGEASTDSIIMEGGSEQPTPIFDSGRSDTSGPERDSGRSDTSRPERDSGRLEIRAPLGDASTSCSDATVECDAECGTIVDGCGNLIECGRCKPGLICVNYSCVSECNGCEINAICYATGAVNPANQCEICSPANSVTSWSPNSGALCDDGKFCTVSDVCDNTVCHGTSRNCNDGIGCNGQETCSEIDGTCLPGTPTCGESQYCDAATNACVSICGATECIINRTCYQNGAHNAVNRCFVCDSSTNRDDWSIAVGETCGDAATECSGIDTCDASGNCLPNNAPRGTRCGSTETECSGQDTCDGNGNCLTNHYGSLRPCGTPTECENQDYCDGDGTCFDWGFKFVFSPCGDGPTDCSNQDSCDLWGNCIPNDKPNGTFCDEGDSECSWYACRQGRCDRSRRVPGAACDDGNPCTSNGCLDHNNNCVPGQPLSCDDGLVCTSDSCDPNTGCQHAPIDCDDLNACTTDSCDPITGECQHTPTIDCNDQNVCTTDSCDPITGECQHTPTIDCNDQNACTTDSCDPITAECQHTDICVDAGTGSPPG